MPKRRRVVLAVELDTDVSVAELRKARLVTLRRVSSEKPLLDLETVVQIQANVVERKK